MSQYCNEQSQRPEITVILPCYNHAEFLAERIASICNQTLKPRQIIFLDDSSTDASIDIARKQFEKFNINAIFKVNAKNSSSPFAQWNQGIELARHDLVWIAETDDNCENTLLEDLYNKLCRDNSVLCFSQSRQISERGEELGSLRHYTELHWPGVFAHDFCCHGHVFNAKFMTRLNAIPNASAVLFRRDAFIRAGKANPSMRFCGDWDAWLRVSEQGRVSYLSQELNMFRCHGGTTRSEEVSPRQDAEKFACRIRACLYAANCLPNSMHTASAWESITLDIAFLKTLATPLRNDLLFSISEFGSRRFWTAFKAYQLLNKVPPLGFAGWLTVVCIKISLAIRQMLVTFLM